jgi:repressor LexA
MGDDLTPRQRSIYEYIRGHTLRHGYPPTIREIGEHFGIRSTNGVNDHLKALERKGALRRSESKSRALVPAEPAGATDAGRALGGIPVLGSVPAGPPGEALEQADDHLQIDESLVPNDPNVFALTVRGDSMIGDGIHDGDLIFVRHDVDPSPGRIVVAKLDGEATVKRYYREAGAIRLQPSNPGMEPILIPKERADGACVVGTVIGVFRKI